MNWRLVGLTVFVSALYYAPFGYESDVLNNPEEVIEAFTVETLEKRYGLELDEKSRSFIWAFIVAMFPVGQLIGSLLGSSLADKFGRKPCLVIVCNTLAIIAGTVLFLPKLAGLVELLPVGRFLSGIRIGISTTITATYMMEVVPDGARGTVGSAMDLSSSLGTIVVYGLSITALGSKNLWPILLGAGAFVGILGLATGFLLRESQKYLLITKLNSMEAAKSVRYFHGIKVDASSVLDNIRTEETDSFGNRNLKLKENVVRYASPLLFSALIGSLPGVSAYLALGAYSTPMLQDAGLDLKTAEAYSLASAFFEVLGSSCALWLTQRYSRRRLLLVTSTLFIIFLIFYATSLTLSQHFPDQKWLGHLSGVVLLMVNMVCCMGPFPLSTVLPSELAPQPVRALSSTIANSSLSFTSIIAQMSIWPLYVSISGFAFLPFILLTSIWTIIFCLKLPETHPDFCLYDTGTYSESEPLLIHAPLVNDSYGSLPSPQYY